MHEVERGGVDAGWRFDNSYARLPAALFSRLGPVPVRRPGIAVLNEALARGLGLDPDTLAGEAGAAVFAGNRIPPGADPLAQAYAGHQYGRFTNLGDGRAILLGEQIAPDGARCDIQLKGSGVTPYSRRGDGRAALGPMLREYIVSETMHALGIPTTRSLSVATTGEAVAREQALPGAVLARVAASHIRVGTFEYAAALGDREILSALVTHALGRHYPELDPGGNPARVLLGAVVGRQASLVAKWMLVGFVHGVMNTDNMAISGETIDYGPCAFMDTYDEATVFSSIDRHGRYAYGNQPRIAQWNLARFAESLLPLLHDSREEAAAMAEEVVGAGFAGEFRGHWEAGLRAKLGLSNVEDDDIGLAKDLLELMRETGADFAGTFAALAGAAESSEPGGILAADVFRVWVGRWKTRLGRQPQALSGIVALLRSVNPAVIPRNHNVEEALKAAVERGDYTVMQRLLGALAKPFEETAANQDYRLPPGPGRGVYQTFCGT